MKKLKIWQIVLLIIFWPVGIVYLCIWLRKEKGLNVIASAGIGVVGFVVLLALGISSATYRNSIEEAGAYSLEEESTAEEAEELTSADETETEKETTTTTEKTTTTTTTVATTTTTAVTTTTATTTVTTPTQTISTTASASHTTLGVVYIAASGNGKKYHISKNCSGMNGDVIEMTREEAEAAGYTPCQKNSCYG